MYETSYFFKPIWSSNFYKALGRSQQYDEVLEHSISPEATFPVLGRSSVYRIAVFQLVGYLATHDELP